MISEIRTFKEEETGCVIQSCTEMVGDGKISLCSKETYHSTIGLPTGDGQSIPVTVDFPEGYTLAECFEKFQEEAEKAVEEFVRKYEEEKKEQANAILTPAEAGVTPSMIDFPKG